jgi:hypothetical protein
MAVGGSKVNVAAGKGKALPKKLSQTADTMPEDWHYLGREIPSF